MSATEPTAVISTIPGFFSNATLLRAANSSAPPNPSTDAFPGGYVITPVCRSTDSAFAHV
ncbi:hypothetical protein [Rhodococcus sp. JT-3]|uniref:hypothetical protein n=1 Tax=Rhodococcus sp. JT-3 TaxID=1973213 RepID=UPI0013036002|nr:hypothetical protein [Rhodococcus sp. JT-3]